MIEVFSSRDLVTELARVLTYPKIAQLLRKASVDPKVALGSVLELVTIEDVPHIVNVLVTGGRPHSPDEYFVIEGEKRVLGLYDCEKGYVNFMYRFALN